MFSVLLQKGSVDESVSPAQRVGLAFQIAADLNLAPCSSAGSSTYTLQVSGTSCNLVLLPYGNYNCEYPHFRGTNGSGTFSFAFGGAGQTADSAGLLLIY